MSDVLTARELFDETRIARNAAAQNIEAEQEATKRYLDAVVAWERAEDEAFINYKLGGAAVELAKAQARRDTIELRAAKDAAHETLRTVRGARGTWQRIFDAYRAIGYSLNSEIKMADSPVGV